MAKAKLKFKPVTPREKLFAAILNKFETKVIDGELYSCLKHDKDDPAAISALFHFIEDELAKQNKYLTNK